MLGRHRPGPALDGRSLDLDGGAAAAADEVVVVSVRAAPVDRLAVLRPQHVDLAGLRQLLQGAVHRGQADRLAAAPQQVVDLLGRPEVRERGERLGDRAPLPGGAGAAQRRGVGSVLVIVPVGCVPMAVVDVVDVVLVGDGDVAAVGAVLVGVLVRGGLVLVGVAGGERLSSRRCRSQAPTGQVRTKPARDSRTMVEPGATGVPAGASADRARPPTDATMPSTMAAPRVPRTAQLLREVATGTTISAETSSRPTVRIATVTLTAASTATSTL